MAEWLKAPVLKTGVAQVTAGSNPVPSASDVFLNIAIVHRRICSRECLFT